MIVETVPSRNVFETLISDTNLIGAEMFNDPAGLRLFIGEEESIENACDQRRLEFTTVRHCARLALTLLGVEPAPILRGKDGAPVWPKNVIGSMTHCEGYRLAVVGYLSEIVSVGIDAEPHLPLPEGVLPVICVPSEKKMLADLWSSEPNVHWDRILFSAKESVYKAWYPLAKRWLDFDEVAIVIDSDAMSFTATFLVPGPKIEGFEVTRFEGQWTISHALIVTSVIVGKDSRRN